MFSKLINSALSPSDLILKLFNLTFKFAALCRCADKVAKAGSAGFDCSNSAVKFLNRSFFSFLSFLKGLQSLLALGDFLFLFLKSLLCLDVLRLVERAQQLLALVLKLDADLETEVIR